MSETRLQDSMERVGALALDWRARAERYETALLIIAACKGKTLISVELGRPYTIGANAAFEECAAWAEAALAQASGGENG